MLALIPADTGLYTNLYTRNNLHYNPLNDIATIRCGSIAGPALAGAKTAALRRARRSAAGQPRSADVGVYKICFAL